MEALRDGVMGLVRDLHMRQRLGEAARRKIFEQGWLWEENARRVEELVEAARPRGGAFVPAANREVRSC